MAFLCTLCVLIQLGDKRANKERKVLFNDGLNTFYLRLYGERGNPLQPHGLLFPISSKGFYMHYPSQDNTHHGHCYTSRGAQAGTK